MLSMAGGNTYTRLVCYQWQEEIHTQGWYVINGRRKYIHKAGMLSMAGGNTYTAVDC